MPLSALQILLVAGAVQGGCLSVLLFTRQENHLANRLLGLLILLFSFQTVLVGFDTRDFFLTFPHLSKIGWILPTLFGPLLFLFTKKLTSEKAELQPDEAVHLLPFLVYLFLLAPYFLQSAEAKILYLNNFEHASVDDFGILNQITNGIHLFYAIGALLLIRRHEQNILQNFSEIRRVRLQWLKQFILFVFFIVMFGVFIFYARKWHIPLVTDLYHYHYLGVVICIYWIGYKALAQPAIFHPIPDHQLISTEARVEIAGDQMAATAVKESGQAIPKYQKSGLLEEAAEAYRQKLLDYMLGQKPYLKNNFSIQDLAQETGIPKHHLSRIINEKLGKNFFDFINEYRVEEAQRLLIDPKFKHYTTLAIAMEAGFNAKATFNAVFKKQTGLTPSEYIDKKKIVV